jgi:glycosyltransferase involved in cell wall biosynthesis
LPRIGMNPGRGKKSDYLPARVTIAVLTYIPNQVGYFQNRLDVTLACLESIFVNTSVPYDLMVFDNGSEKKTVQALQKLEEAGKIDFLILSSKNIGKIGALQVMLKAAPGEVIAYCDDDVFFLPGWLERHLEVIDTYPKVGMVSGMYIKPHMKEGISAALKFAKSSGVKAERGNLVDRDLEQHYIDQMGRTWEKYQEEIAGLEDVRLTYKGVQVFVSAGHYQFTSPKNVILQALPTNWTGNLMGQMRDLDVAIDQLGFLRLCTTPPTLRLLGNLIDKASADELRKYGVDVMSSLKPEEKVGLKQKIFRSSLVKKAAYFLYERLFKIINS